MDTDDHCKLWCLFLWLVGSCIAVVSRVLARKPKKVSATFQPSSTLVFHSLLLLYSIDCSYFFQIDFFSWASKLCFGLSKMEYSTVSRSTVWPSLIAWLWSMASPWWFSTVASLRCKALPLKVILLKESLPISVLALFYPFHRVNGAHPLSIKCY